MGFGAEEGVAFPVFGGVAVFGFGDDVEIAADDEGGVGITQAFEVCVEAFHPFEFVVVFWAGSRIAVGGVDVYQAHIVDIGFDVAGLFVRIIAGEVVVDYGDGMP